MPSSAGVPCHDPSESHAIAAGVAVAKRSAVRTEPPPAACMLERDAPSQLRVPPPRWSSCAGPRRGASAPFEVLLLRRSPAMTFVAGAHVFPGGRSTTPTASPIRQPAATGSTHRAGSLTSRRPPSSRFASPPCGSSSRRPGVLLARRRGGWATTGEAEDLRRQLDEGSRSSRLSRRRLAARARCPRAVLPDRHAPLGAAALRHALLPGRAPRGPDGATRCGRVGRARLGDAGPGARARLERRGRPAAADVGDAAAALVLRVRRRDARVGEEQDDRADRAGAHPRARRATH